jgi:hypothetical protein
MNLEDRIRVALRATDVAAPRTGAGAAYERFLLRRRRHARTVTALTSVAFALMLGAAALVPQFLAERDTEQPAATGSILRKARQGFEFQMPSGWEVASDTIDQPGFEGSLRLRPVGWPEPRKGQPGMGSAPEIVLSMWLHAPDTYPGRPAPDPGTVPAELVRTSMLSDDPSAPRPGRRSDDRAYLVLDSSAGGDGGSRSYAIAWPYHCATGARCSDVGAYRVLAMSGHWSSGQGTMVRQVLENLVETIRPIGNGLPGGAPPDEVPDLPYTAPVEVGTAETGALRWTVSAQWHDQGDPLWSSGVTTRGQALRRQALRSVLARFQLDGGGRPAVVDTAGYGLPGTSQKLWAQGLCLGPDSDPGSWVPTLVGMADDDAVTVRFVRRGGTPVDVPVIGRDKGFGVGFFAGPALPRDTQVPRLQAIDAAGRVLYEITRYDGFDRLCTGRQVVR